MPLYAMINDTHQFVADVVEWDGTTDNWIPPAGHTMVPIPDGAFCAAGFTYDGTNFVPPPQGQDGPLIAAALRAQAGR